MGSSGPPAAGTVQKRGAGEGAHEARPEANTTDLPSGVQPCTWSGPGCQVRRRGTPPSSHKAFCNPSLRLSRLSEKQMVPVSQLEYVSTK